MKKFILLPLLLCFFALSGFSQYNIAQDKIWVFGTNAGLDFTSGTPTAISTSINTSEGTASVSDSMGSLLFYTDGDNIYNRYGGIMPHGDTVAPWSTASTSQAALIVPVIGSPSQYYVFSLESYSTSTGYSHLIYCKVDMSLDSGRGDVITSTLRTAVTNKLAEKMTAVAGNHCDIWLVTHLADSAVFLSYDITASGISSTPVYSRLGSFSGANCYSIGDMMISPDRTKIATQVYGTGSGQGSELYDFNATTGVVSNCRLLDSTSNCYGGEFSPDNSKFYSGSYGGAIYQYDITGSTAGAIRASRYTVTSTGYTALKLGPDGKIYFGVDFGSSSLSCIGSPNVSGSGCGLVSTAVTLASGTSVSLGFPNIYIASGSASTSHAVYDTTACVGATDSILLSARTTGASYVWDNGATTSTRSIGAAGRYYVTIYNGCSITVDSFRVSARTVSHLAVISGPSSVCVGATISLTDSTTGGGWSSSNITVASVSSSVGNVTGVSAGTAVITYTISGTCGAQYVTKTITVAPAPAAPRRVVGPETSCLYATSVYTDSTTGGNWSTSDASIATIDGSGNLIGVSLGTVTITYTVANSCGTAYAVKTISITGPPTVGGITGASSVCIGSTVTLSDATAGGIWASGNPSIATVNSTTGVVSGVAAGSAVITYTVANSCGSSFATFTINVVSTPYVSAVTGPTTVCQGASITLTDSMSGGTWISGTTAVATITSGGVLTGISAGTTVVSYFITTTCGTAAATKTITVNPLPTAPAAISGAATVCQGASITLTDATTGGMWSSSNAAIATVTAGGVVNGITTGTVTISYGVTNSCGSTYATKSITVNSAPTIAAIAGAASVCTGSSVTLTDATAGGTWTSSTPSIATVTSGGVVTGVATGASVISYTVTSACGTTSVTKTINVITLPSVAAISGAASICTGASTAYTDVTTGGAWSSVATTVATVTGSGMVYGLTAGTTTISYTLTNSCGSAAATKVVTVSATPSAGTISGASTLCTGVPSTLTDAVTGGTWSSSNTAIATINSGGTVAGITTGTVTITYSVTTICGSAIATKIININPSPNAGTISGATSLCSGATTTLTDAVTGGSWSSAATTVAAVSAAGVVTAGVAGTVTISYSVTNSCGTAVAIKNMTVNALPAAGTITGATTVCSGGTVTLTDATSGGVWSSSNTAQATVSAAGVVTGVSGGTVSISYTVSGSCGTAVAGHVVSVTAAPSVAAITGATGLCAGATTTLADATVGGTWSSSNTAVATVNSTTGVVSGAATGTATITYTVVTSCATAYAVASITVSPSASAGAITGLSGVCSGSTITLAATGSAGGTWSSSNTAVATVVGGIVRGVTGGVVTISYSVSSACGTVVATKTVTVTATPSVSAISGATSICLSSSSTYTDATSGGGWISSNTAVATVNSGGVVTGVGAGTATLTYFVTNSCGTATTTKLISVNTLTAGVISGAASIAVGASTTLTNTVVGGVWSSTNTARATITSTGMVTGVSVGTDTIRYSVTNSCGTATASKTLTISAHRDAPASIAATTTDGDINVYPNPNNGTFTIAFPGDTKQASCYIADLNGRMLYSQETTEQTLYVDMTKFAAGTYLLRVEADGQIYSRKVVLR